MPTINISTKRAIVKIIETFKASLDKAAESILREEFAGPAAFPSKIMTDRELKNELDEAEGRLDNLLAQLDQEYGLVRAIQCAASENT